MRNQYALMFDDYKFNCQYFPSYKLIRNNIHKDIIGLCIYNYHSNADYSLCLDIPNYIFCNIMYVLYVRNMIVNNSYANSMNIIVCNIDGYYCSINDSKWKQIITTDIYIDNYKYSIFICQDNRSIISDIEDIITKAIKCTYNRSQSISVLWHHALISYEVDPLFTMQYSMDIDGKTLDTLIFTSIPTISINILHDYIDHPSVMEMAYIAVSMLPIDIAFIPSIVDKWHDVIIVNLSDTFFNPMPIVHNIQTGRHIIDCRLSTGYSIYVYKHQTYTIFGIFNTKLYAKINPSLLHSNNIDTIDQYLYNNNDNNTLHHHADSITKHSNTKFFDDKVYRSYILCGQHIWTVLISDIYKPFITYCMYNICIITNIERQTSHDILIKDDELWSISITTDDGNVYNCGRNYNNYAFLICYKYIIVDIINNKRMVLYATNTLSKRLTYKYVEI